MEENAAEKARMRRWIEETLLGNSENSDPKNLMLILSIIVASASLSMFGSTLLFRAGQDGFCTFVVGWFGLSAEMIRIIAFIRIGLDLRALGTKRWEMYLTWLYILGSVALMIANNVLAPGILRIYYKDGGLALCSRQHLVITALLTALFNILFEVYAAFRFAIFLAPSFLRLQHRLEALQDLRMAKCVSLLLLELLTIVPFIIPVNIAAECIPFALASAIVVAVFNQEHAQVTKALTRVDSIPSTRMLNIFRENRESIAPPTSPLSEFHFRTSSERHQSVRRQRAIEHPPFSLEALTEERERALRKLSRASKSRIAENPYAIPGSAPAVMVERSVRVWPAIPVSLQRASREAAIRQSTRQSTGSFKRYSDFPSPPPNPPTTSTTPVFQIPAPANTSKPLPASPMRKDHSARRYDPSRVIGTNPVDPQVVDAPATTSKTSAASNPYWYMLRGDRISPVHGTVRTSKHRSMMGSNLQRASTRSDRHRRSSVDSGGRLPYNPVGSEDEGEDVPPSPFTAPARSHHPVQTPVMGTNSNSAAVQTASGVLATGVAEPMSSTRIRFGARPMRNISQAESSFSHTRESAGGSNAGNRRNDKVE